MSEIIRAKDRFDSIPCREDIIKNEVAAGRKELAAFLAKCPQEVRDFFNAPSEKQEVQELDLAA